MLTPPDRAAVLRTVCEELLAVRARRHPVALPIDAHTRLAELGIGSLDLAEVVSTLEATFGVDPFAEHVAITSLTDVASLCDAYVSVLAGGAAAADPLDDELRALRGRGPSGLR